MEIAPEIWNSADKLIAGAKRVLISGHIGPDGDCLGAMMAITSFLEQQGIECVATAELSAIGRIGLVMPGIERIVPVCKLGRLVAASKKKQPFDLLIAVDCAAFSRMPAKIKTVAEKLPRLCIDHHLTSDENFANVTIIDSSASSTCELVCRLAMALDWKFNQDIAEALWIGMVTDTGRFAYDSTKPSTLRTAAMLLEYGVRTSYINDVIFASFAAKSIALKRIAWRSLHIWKNRRVAEVTLSREDFKSVHGKKADAEDTVDIPRSVEHNEIAIFFYQMLDNAKEVHCSIRTRGNWDATVLAGRFGGGGHKKAAGCVIKGTLGVAKRQMRAAIKEMLKEGPTPAS